MNNFTSKYRKQEGPNVVIYLVGILLALLLSIVEAKAQSNHTVTFSGNVTDFNAAEKITAAANNTDYYLTFDENNLYLGAFRTSGTFGATDNFTLYIDSDPNPSPTSGTGTTTGQSYNSVTGTLPFSANYNVHAEESYQEARSFGSSWASTIAGVTYWTNSTTREVKIPFSSIGTPHALYLTLWMGYSGGFFSNAPGANIGASSNPTITNYFGGIGISSADCLPVNITNTPITDVITNTVPASGALYGKVIVNSGTVTATNNFNIAAGGSIAVTDATLDLSNSTIEMGGNTIGNGRGTTLNTAGTGILTTSSTTTINFNGAGNIKGNALTLNGITRINNKFTPLPFGGLTIGANAALDIRTGAYINTNPPTYATGSELMYNSGTIYVASTEWATAASGTGVPSKVVIGNAVANSGVSFGTSSASRYTISDLTISNGTTGSFLTLSSVAGGDVYVGGNWTRASSGSFNPNGRAVFFNGSTTQLVTVNGGGTETFNYLNIGGSGTLQLTTGTNITINTNNGLTLASTHPTSTLDLNGQTFTVTGGGNLSLASDDRKITSSLAGGIFKLSTNGIGITNPGTLVFDTSTTLVLETGFDFGTGNPTTINGTLQLNTGAFVNVNAPKYGASSLLKYNSGSDYERRIEWNADLGSTYGVPHHVTITNNTTLNYPFAPSGPRGMTGDLTIDYGSKLFMDYGALSSNGPLTVMGNIVSAGDMTLGTVAGNDLKVGGHITFSTGYTFETKGRAVFFLKDVASGIQTITAPVSAPPTFDYLVFQPSSGSTTLQLNTDLTLTAPNAGHIISFSNANDIFDLNGKTLTLGTTSTNNTLFGSGSFKGSTTSSLTLLGNGSIGTINFTENFRALGTFTINRQNATTAVNLGTDLTIHSSLALAKGLVFLDTNNITLTTTAACSGGSANSFVIADATTTGKFKKSTNNSTGVFTFPIGDRTDSDDGANYAPATISFSDGDYSATAYVALAVKDLKHPSIDASATNYITRYWKLTTAGISENPTYSFTGTYLPTDIAGTETNSKAGRWNGNEWTEGTAVGSNSLNITLNTGIGTDYTNEIGAGNPLGNSEINIKGNNNDIVSGDTNPSWTDLTDFGNLPTSRYSTFLIQNTTEGKAPLILTNVAISGINASDFIITTSPTTTIPVGETGYLILKFAPSDDGLRTATVTIINNDPDEGNYTFDIQGQGIDYTECSFGPEETIFTQDFEDVPLVPTLTYSMLSGGIVASGTGYAVSGDGGNTNSFIGAKSLQINNATAAITFEPIDTSNLSEVSFSFRLAAISNESGLSGLDNADYIRISVSKDEGFSWTDEIEIRGNSNSKWSFGGSGISTAIYDGNSTIETKYAPSSGGYRTADGYSTISVSNLPITDNLQIKITGSNNDANEIWTIDDAVIKAKRKSKKTWDGTNWIGGDGNAPIAFEIAIIGEDYDSATSGSFEGCGCEVGIGKTLTIASGDYLDLQSDLKNEGTIIFEDSSSLVQHNEVALNTGNVTIQRNTQPIFRYDYTYWSSPLAWGSGFQLGNNPISLSPITLFDKFFSWTHDSDPQAWHPIPYGNEQMNPGTGYIVRAPQNYAIEGQPGAVAAAYTANFVGIANNGTVEINVTGDLIDDKWNLIGNPYPSAIDIESFLAFNEDYLEGTIYLWTHNTQIQEIGGTGTYQYSPSDYACYNFSGATATAPAVSGGLTPTQFLASGQAFFVKGLDSGTVVFKNTMRVRENNNLFYKPGLSQPINNWDMTGKHRIWLNLTGQNAFNQTMVGYIQNATNDLDWGYDGAHFGGNKVTLYSVLGAEKLVIQGRALPFNDQDQVPLGYKTTLTGTLKISIDHYDGLFESQGVYLEDLQLNTIHDLKASDYIFTTVPGTFNNRFILRYVPQETLTNPEIENIIAQVIISKEKNELNVKSALENITKITVYDALGRMVLIQDKINSNVFRATDIVYGRQTLIVKVALANNTIVTKKVIY